MAAADIVCIVCADGGLFVLLSMTDGHYWSSVLPAMMVMGVSVGLFAAPLTTVAMAAAGPGGDGRQWR